MKNLLILILICFAQNAFSQTIEKGDPNSSNIVAPIELIPSDNPNSEYNIAYPESTVETKPEFPGGNEAFQLFIKKNYKQTESSDSKGKIYLTFIIEKDGSLTDIKVIRDFGHGSGEEAINVLKKSPNWIPGKHKGKILKVQKLIAMLIE